jgi:Leucine-rich repeat (LRR) protein
MKIITKIVKVFFSILITTVLLSCIQKINNSHEQLNNVTQSEMAVSEAESGGNNIKPVNELEVITPEPVKKYVSSWTDPVSDISFLMEMPELEEVNIRGNSLLTDISPLSSLTQLKSLTLSYTPNIQSIDPLSNLINLEYLLLDYRKPTDCAALGNLKNLKELVLAATPITNIHYIASLSELESLSLFITDENINIYELGQLTNLKKFYLYGDNVRIDLSGLRQLINLEHISLRWFVDLDLSPLRSLSRLEFVDLDRSTVSNIMSLLDNEAIKGLYLPLNYNELPKDFYDRLRTTNIRWQFIDGR